MKKNYYGIILMVALMIIATSCSLSDYEMEEGVNKKKVTFVCGGDFELESVTSMTTRALPVYAADIWVFDYVGGKYIQEVHQKSGDPEFGRPTIELGYGTHNLYFVISDGSGAKVNNGDFNITWDRPGDTFHASLVVEIGKDSYNNFTVDMNRVVAKLAIRVESESGFPINSQTFEIKTSKSWYRGMNYVTGNANNSSQEQFTCKTKIPEFYKGKSSITTESDFYTLTTGENSFYVNSELSVCDNEGIVIGAAYLKDIEMTRGKCCTYTGSFIYLDSGDGGSTGISQFDFNVPDWENGTSGTW